MLNIREYPRGTWNIWLWLTAGFLSAGIIFGYGVPVGNRVAAVVEAQDNVENATKSNHFWRMVSGDDPMDDSDLGKVAAATRELADRSNPIGEMMDHYIGPGDLPDIGDTLGFHAFERTDPNDGNKKRSDAGRFTDTFILHTIQATGEVEGSSVKDLMHPIPEVPSYGWLRWEWGIGALAAVLGIATVVGCWLRRDRRRWPARERARALAELTSEQLEVYRIIVGLQAQDYSEQRDQLLDTAKALFRDMELGLGNETTGTGGKGARDRIVDLRAALADVEENWRLQQEAYADLPKPGARTVHAHPADDAAATSAGPSPVVDTATEDRRV